MKVFDLEFHEKSKSIFADVMASDKKYTKRVEKLAKDLAKEAHEILAKNGLPTFVKCGENGHKPSAEYLFVKKYLISMVSDGIELATLMFSGVKQDESNTSEKDECTASKTESS